MFKVESQTDISSHKDYNEFLNENLHDSNKEFLENRVKMLEGELNKTKALLDEALNTSLKVLNDFEESFNK